MFISLFSQDKEIAAHLTKYNYFMLNFRLEFFLFFSLLIPSIVYSETKCVGSTCFEKVLLKEKNLNLVGVSLFEYFLIDVYAAALYSEKPVSDKQSVFEPNSSKFLILNYYVEIKKEDFIESTKKLLLTNKDIDQNKVSKDFEAVYDAFENVKSGDRYSLYYDSSNQKTCLALNDVNKVCREGYEFFKAFFGIWISDYSVDEKFTRRLIGKN
jgi:hypothetical protein